MAPFKNSDNGHSERVPADSIRDSIGYFTKLSHYPARKAARISQAFSATAPSVILKPEDILEVPDKTFKGNNLTDGVGTMSSELCVAVTDALNRERPTPLPSLIEAIQFRLGGFKGMLSLHDQLKSHSEQSLRTKLPDLFAVAQELVCRNVSQAFHEQIQIRQPRTRGV